MDSTGFKQFVLNKYKEKHRSCGKCQQRWNSMKENIKPLQQAPKFLEKRAQHSGDMLWGENNGK